MTKKITTIMLLSGSLALSGCATNAQTDALGGGAIGAGIGAAVGGGDGAIAGGLIGAGAGALLGNEKDKQEQADE